MEMQEFDLQSENDIKENYLLTKNPIVKLVNENMSPKMITPLKKLNENFRTPLRGNGFLKSYTPGTPFAQTPTQDLIIETPNGSKIVHPVLSNIRNLDRLMTSPDFSFNEYSVQDDSVLSPDLGGELFPDEIDDNVDSAIKFEANILKKYAKYCEKKSEQYFNKTHIPSPQTYDSGLGISFQTSSNPSFLDSSRASFGPMSLLLHNTPPSKYKWNRDEYRDRNESLQFPSMELSDNEEDEEEERSYDFRSHKYNMESTKIFDDSASLAGNVSMRNHSVIESPMFDDGDGFGEEEDMSFCGIRSSPSWNSKSKLMDDLAMSPINGDCSGSRRRRMSSGRGESMDC